MVQEAIKQCKDDFKVEEIPYQNNFELVYCQGGMSTQFEIKDEEFNLSVQESVKLKRVVEIYLYFEQITTHIDNKGVEQKRFHYKPVWQQFIANSSPFHDSLPNQNPIQIPFQSVEIINQQVNLGEFILSCEQIKKFNQYQDIQLTYDQAQQIIDSSQKLFYQRGYCKLQQKGNYLWSRQFSQLQTQNQYVNKIGDVRISWQNVNLEQDIVVIAQQIENEQRQITFRRFDPQNKYLAWGQEQSFQEEDTKNEFCCMTSRNQESKKQQKSDVFETIDIIEIGKREPNAIFQEIMNQDLLRLYSFRVLSWLLNLLGHFLIISTLIKSFGWHPVLQSIFGLSQNLNSLIYAVIWGNLVYLTILSFIWIRLQPFFSLALFSVVAGSMYFLYEFY